MTRTTGIFACAALLFAALGAGCATPKKAPGLTVEEDVARVIKLGDGTLCTEPAGLAETRTSAGAVQLRELFDSDMQGDEAAQKAKELKLSREEVEAVYFDACRAYSNAEIRKEAFDKDSRIYRELRQQLVAQGIKAWQDKKDGIADAGKLCLVTLPDTDPEHRSFTRLVPADATVGDCALLASRNGSSEILLGCTRGHWEDVWAKSPIAVNPAAVKTLNLSAQGGAHAPDPNCGWN
jgi:hypothetical protein